MPPSEATNQYPRPERVDAIPTIGAFKRIAPVEPKNRASPKLNMPPSEATNQYPRPDGVAATATTGCASSVGPVDP
jgi:hypothetical protein